MEHEQELKEDKDPRQLSLEHLHYPHDEEHPDKEIVEFHVNRKKIKMAGHRHDGI